MEALVVIFLVAALLIGGGIFLLVSFTSLVIHIVAIALLIMGGLWLWNRLLGRRGTRTSI